MTLVAAILVPVIVAYKIWVYRLFHARVEEKDVLINTESY